MARGSGSVSMHSGSIEFDLSSSFRFLWLSSVLEVGVVVVGLLIVSDDDDDDGCGMIDGEVEG